MGWVTASLQTLFAEYYGRVASLTEEVQYTIDLGGRWAEFNVSADAAALQVRRIVTGMLEEEGVEVGRPLRSPGAAR